MKANDNSGWVIDEKFMREFKKAFLAYSDKQNNGIALKKKWFLSIFYPKISLLTIGVVL